MIETYQAFSEAMKNGPPWVFIWINIMTLVVFVGAAVFSFVRKEARFVLLSLLLIMPAMLWMFSYFGYEKILGLPHVIFWTPLLIYLWRRRSEWRVLDTWSGKWLALVSAVIAISLLFDYTDVALYLLGHRS